MSTTLCDHSCNILQSFHQRKIILSQFSNDEKAQILDDLVDMDSCGHLWWSLFPHIQQALSLRESQKHERNHTVSAPKHIQRQTPNPRPHLSSFSQQPFSNTSNSHQTFHTQQPFPPRQTSHQSTQSAQSRGSNKASNKSSEMGGESKQQASEEGRNASRGTRKRQREKEEDEVEQEAKKRNASLYRGVHRERGWWVATITHQLKRKRIGRYVQEEEAARMYDREARILHRDKAKLNFPDEEEEEEEEEEDEEENDGREVDNTAQRNASHKSDGLNSNHSAKPIKIETSDQQSMESRSTSYESGIKTKTEPKENEPIVSDDSEDQSIFGHIVS